METAILLLLLALSDKNESMKDTLNRFLCFYKEHRELIQMLAGILFSSSAPSAAPREECEKSRPCEKVGCSDILEEYLRRANA